MFSKIKGAENWSLLENFNFYLFYIYKPNFKKDIGNIKTLFKKSSEEKKLKNIKKLEIFDWP